MEKVLIFRVFRYIGDISCHLCSGPDHGPASEATPTAVCRPPTANCGCRQEISGTGGRNTDLHLMGPNDINLAKTARTKDPPPSLNELKEATPAPGTLSLMEKVAWLATSVDFPSHLDSTASSSTKSTKASKASEASKAAKTTQAASRSFKGFKVSEAAKVTEALILVSEEV